MRIIETKDGAILKVSVRPQARDFKTSLETDEIIVFPLSSQPKEKSINKS